MTPSGERGSKLKKLFGLLASASEKRPWLVVLAVAIVTLFMGAGMPRITTELSQESMMPKGYESIVAFDRIEDIFGGVSYENALVVADDVTSPEIAAKLLALTPESLEERGMEEGWITGVQTYLDGLMKMLEQQGQPVPPGQLLGMAVEQFMATPYAQGQVVGKSVSEDLKATLVKFQLSPDISESESTKLANKLEEILDEDFGPGETGETGGTQAFLSGSASMHRDQQEMMNRETSILMSAAILFIMLILYLTFRRVSDIFLPLLIIIVAIQWLMGFMGWVGIPYTTMSVAIMPLMLGINIAYVIHVLSRYYEERESGKDIFASATGSVKTVGVAVFLTALTTVIGFSSFIITDLPQMRDFGLICMVGITFSFILTLTLLPAVVILRDRRKKSEKLEQHLEKMRARRRDARYGVVVDRGLVGAATSAVRHHWVVLGCLVVVAGFSVFAGFNLRTGADIRTMFPDDMPSAKASAKISEIFGSQNFDMVLVEGDIYEPESLEAMLAMADAMASDPRNSEIERGKLKRSNIVSIADMVAAAGGGQVPPSREAVEAVVGRLKANADLGRLVSDDGKNALVMVGSEFSDTEEESRTKSDIMRDAASGALSGTGLKATATGMSVLITDLMGKMVPTQLKTSALALLLCLLVLVVVFKSFWYGLATLTVVAVGLIVEMVILYVLRWPLDFMTVTISALVIGAGVDYGIHITHRFREQLHDRKTSLEEAVKITVLHVGRSLVAAAFTTAGVFAILGISTMVPMRRFGWTVAVGLMASLIGAVIVLPSLLAIISKRKHEVLNGGEVEGAIANGGEVEGEPA